MRTNRSFQILDSINDQQDKQTSLLHYDIQKLYHRIKTKDLVIYVLQRMCESVLRELSDPELPIVGFSVVECIRTATLHIKPRLQGEIKQSRTIWNCLEDVTQYSHYKSDDLFVTIKKHRQAMHIVSCDVSIKDVLTNLILELKSHYQPIHVFRPIGGYQQMMAFAVNYGFNQYNAFSDVYRSKALEQQLLSSVVHIVFRKRSKSQANPSINPRGSMPVLQKSGRDVSISGSQSESSMTSVISTVSNVSTNSNVNAITEILNNIAQRVADQRSNVSDNGSDQQSNSPIPVIEDHALEELPVQRSECASQFIPNYFVYQKSEVKSNGSSFVVVSSCGSHDRYTLSPKRTKLNTQVQR